MKNIANPSPIFRYFPFEVAILNKSKNNIIFVLGRLGFWLGTENRTPVDDRDNHYFDTDQPPFVYEPISTEFGPLNISAIFKYWQLVNRKLIDETFGDKNVIHYTGPDRKKCVNAALLMGTYAVSK